RAGGSAAPGPRDRCREGSTGGDIVRPRRGARGDAGTRSRSPRELRRGGARDPRGRAAAEEQAPRPAKEPREAAPRRKGKTGEGEAGAKGGGARDGGAP